MSKVKTGTTPCKPAVPGTLAGPVVRSHILRDYHFNNWHSEIEGCWHYNRLYNDMLWHKGWISFDAVTWNTDEQCLYCGLNSLDGDIFYRFRPGENRFESLNARQWANEFDSKIHRTILRNPEDGKLYFATSMLHDIDRQHEAPGGKLMRYDPRTGTFELLAIPFPQLYIQSIAADFERGKIYCFTYPAEFVVCFDMHSGKSRTLAYITNATSMVQPHNGVVDNQGYFWGTYAETRAFDEVPSKNPVRLFRYHPDTGKFDWFDFGLSKKSDSRQLLAAPRLSRCVAFHSDQTRHKDDYGFCDSMVFDGSRYIYAGTTGGSLCRIDTLNPGVEKLADVMPAGRLPALNIAPDGTLYGGGGLKGDTLLFKWRPGSKHIILLESLEDEQGRVPARIHDLAIDGQGRLYLAENDNHSRSSYLWTVEGF